MTANFRYVIGIDVSKKEFHTCFLEQDQSTLKTRIRGTRKFLNTAKGILKFVSWVDKKRKHLDAIMKTWLGYFSIKVKLFT